MFLIALAALVGLGSFLFHTFANAWSSLADVIPIWTLVALFILVAIHRIGGARPGRIGIGLTVAVGLVAILFAFGGDGSGSQTSNSPAAALDADGSSAPAYPILNGSEQYLPAVLALLAFAALSRRKGHPIAPWVVAAAGAFMVSLTLRTLDMHLYEIWPLGTLFIWHILNGTMIALLFQGLIRSPVARPG